MFLRDRSYATDTRDKNYVLLIFMFMIMKKNDILKSKGVTNGSLQSLHTNTDECLSPKQNLCAFKYIVAVIVKEGRDCVTVDLPGFSLQTKKNKSNIKTTQVVGTNGYTTC